MHPQQEKRTNPQNYSKVEDIVEEDEVKNIDSGNECVVDQDIKEGCNSEDANLEAETKSSKSLNRYDGKEGS